MVEQVIPKEKTLNEEDVLSFQLEIDRIIADYFDNDHEKFFDPGQKNRIKQLIENQLRGKKTSNKIASQLLMEARIYHGNYFEETNSNLWADKVTKISQELDAMKDFIDEYKGSGLLARKSQAEKLDDIRRRIQFTIKFISNLAREEKK